MNEYVVYVGCCVYVVLDVCECCVFMLVYVVECFFVVDDDFEDVVVMQCDCEVGICVGCCELGCVYRGRLIL